MILKKNEPLIVVLGGSQILKYIGPEGNFSYHISTAKNGFGEVLNSYKTPRGWHYIRAIIGTNNPINTHYTGRKITEKSHISGRILWLCGLEPHNHHPKKHSMKRYIYIHGVPKPFLKTPSSKGCINMRNCDIFHLTKILTKYCKVYIDAE